MQESWLIIRIIVLYNFIYMHYSLPNKIEAYHIIEHYKYRHATLSSSLMLLSICWGSTHYEFSFRNSKFGLDLGTCYARRINFGTEKQSILVSRSTLNPIKRLSRTCFLRQVRLTFWWEAVRRCAYCGGVWFFGIVPFGSSTEITPRRGAGLAVRLRMALRRAARRRKKPRRLRFVRLLPR